MIDFADVFTAAGMATLLQVILIDLTMAGDNVVIMGTLASGLPARDRQRVLMFGVGMALVFLIAFALVATWLLKITGLLLAGGLLLLWVAFNMYRELRPANIVVADDPGTLAVEGPPPTKTFLQAAIQVTLADLSMSLDNVLAVAAAAREHPTVLFFGLAFSVTLMGLAANLVAKLVQRYHWIAWIGLLVILYVALKMVWEGAHQVAPIIVSSVV
ncbi:YjbE family putative metal transport protein [Aquisediminimonas profunda]|uniref:YjbE family putative metal transport protein n=1 Tax=Aquisediminimonas profunda TaxID=1550733 RepID=UPI001FE36598|nr:YjbE family putative metal transport protein [Aquisediminimonas profunda]